MPGPYELYFVRHGLAEERGDAWPDDTKRPLTDEGISRMRRGARSLARLGVTVEVVLTSPLVRARQTAEIVAGALDPRPSLVNVDSLAPEGTYAAVVADLEKHARKTRIALVGHEPMMGELAARFLGSRHPIEFKKGGVCRIDVEDLPPAGPADLRWMLTPKILRAMKK
ncbi:MAG: phosphohistidine phosphatase SixA [Vicinamibacterales bacterium]